VVKPGRLIGVVDLGGTKIYSAVVDRDGTVRGDDLRPTEDSLGPETVIERIVASLEGATAAAGTTPGWLRGLGIAAPGPVRSSTGHVLYPPNLAGWRDVPLGTILGERLGLRVVVENDANAAALGEYASGSGQGSEVMVYTTVSTGIGGGIVLGGLLYRGVDGAAGELGHIVIRQNGPLCGCGRWGCLEALASGKAIAREGRLAIEAGHAPLLRSMLESAPGELTAELVADAAKHGDSDAMAIIRDAGVALGLGLASIVDVLNPDVLVIGGGVAKIGSLFLQPAEETLRRAIFAKPALGVELRLAALDYPAVAGMAVLLSP